MPHSQSSQASPRSPRNVPRFLRIAPVLRQFAPEIAAFLAFAAVALLLRTRGFRLDAHALRFTLLPMVGALPRILLLGVAVQLVLALAARRSPVAYLRELVRPLSVIGWLRFCAVLILVTFAYTWLKVCVPLLRHESWDPALWRLDRLIHLGVSPSIFALELLGGALLTLLDLWYSFWVVTIFAAMAWGAAHPSLAARRNFALACAILWTLGSWGYLTVPALGPCYSDPQLFAPARADLPHAATMQARLAENYALMLAGRDGSLRQFNPYLGVAAMPSLHVGAHWLFALWARRHARRFFPPLALATALTFLGSIATGWHWAIDGYAGILLAWLAVVVSDRVSPYSLAVTEPVPAAAFEAPAASA
jgi:hypothetical protein